MSTTIPKQHPAVVLRSQYDHLRAFLALTLVLVVALAATVVLVVANDDDPVTRASQPAALSVGPHGAAGAGVIAASKGTVTSPRHEIALRRDGTSFVVPGSVRYDGGPDEGTRGPGH